MRPSRFSNWIRGNLGQSSPCARQSLQNRRRRLSVERLEDRALLTAHIWTVSTAAGTGTGSLPYDVSHAANGDAINFSPALANKTISLTSGPITIDKQLSISGAGASGLQISGSKNYQIFNIGSEGNVTITALTLKDGQGLFGGAIENAGQLNLNSLVIESSSGLALAGAVANYGSLTISNSAFKGNSTETWGGAIVNADAASLTISNSAFEGNSAPEGGALYNVGTLRLTDSSVVNNSALGQGGAGGGMFNAGRATISNCTFAENHAVDGGALYGAAAAGSTIISESTIAENSATGSGGGVRLESEGAILQVTNTIIADNKSSVGGPDVYKGYDDEIDSLGSNLIGNPSDSSGWMWNDLTGTAKSPLNPLLGSLHTQGIQSYFPLLPGSLALGDGDPVGAPATDQIGHKRVVNLEIDIGAIETQSTAAARSNPVLSNMPPFSAVDGALSTVFAVDSELWSRLSSGTN